MTTDISTEMSADISTDSRSICRPTLGRHLGRYIGRYTWPIGRPLIVGGISVDCRWYNVRLSYNIKKVKSLECQCQVYKLCAFHPLFVNRFYSYLYLLLISYISPPTFFRFSRVFTSFLFFSLTRNIFGLSLYGI